MRLPWQSRRPPLDVRVARAIERAGLDASGIAVTAERGRVTLRGTVADDASRQRIVELVRSVGGVKHVDDRTAVAAVEHVARAPRVRERERPVYVVRAGDTLPDIAERLLGARGRWTELRALNAKVVDGPGPLPAGLKLALPDR